MKILTVVIPTYNVEKYLERCLDSLTYDESILDDLEILVVNDGSKDNSLSIAKKYEKMYSNCIKVIDKENGGHGSTINAGLKVATGKYFRVVDSDDWVNIDDFPMFVKELKKLNADLVITDYRRELIYSGESILFPYTDKIEFDKLYNIEEFDLSSMGNEYFTMATSTYKTEKLRTAKLVLDEHTFYVDMEYNLLAFPQIETFIRLNYDIYRYYIGRPDQSVNINSMIKNRAHHEKVLKRLIEFYSNTKLSNNKKQYVEKVLILLSRTHYIIYCKSTLPSRKILNEIREFDNYMKEKSPKLYNATNKYKFIRFHRKTNFIFAQSNRRIIARIIEKYSSEEEK